VPVAHIDHLKEDKLGRASMAEEVRLEDDSMIFKISGVQSQAKTVTILVRASNNLVNLSNLSLRSSMKPRDPFMTPFAS